MNIWQLQEAKAKLSQLVKDCTLEPQFISVHGEEKAVIISVDQFNHLRHGEKHTFWDFMANSPLSGKELDITRSKDLPRDTEL